MRSRQIALLVLFAVVVAFLWHLRSSRIANFQRARRETGYRETTAELQTTIRPGMTRSTVEQLLRDRSLAFNARRTYEDFIPLAHEASTLWYCGWDQVMILIEFDPVQPAPPAPRPNDLVKAISLSHWPQDCM